LPAGREVEPQTQRSERADQREQLWRGLGRKLRELFWRQLVV